MAWNDDIPTNPPVRQRGIQTGLPGAAVLEEAGYPFNFWSRAKLGLSKFFGGLEPVDKLPTEVFGIPTKGRERLGEWVEFLRPFVTRENFGRNPQDAQDVIEAFAQRSLGLGDVETQRASNLLRVYRNVMAKKRLQELGVFEPEAEEPDKGLVRFMRNQGQ